MNRNTPAQWLREIKQKLKQNHIEDADSAARLMVGSILQMPLNEILLSGQAVAPCQQAQLESALQRRLLGEPVQYILGEAYFYGLLFKVTPDVLIPRMDTETLVMQALEKCVSAGCVLDVCTGSGCVALAIKKERPDCSVCAIDLSPKALSVAKENGKRLQLEAEWLCGDLCRPVEGREFDLIVSNPPYISREEYKALSPLVREYEPEMALLAGEEGLDLYQRLIPQAWERLAPDGWLCLEIGSTQAEAVKRLCENAGFIEITLTCDLAGLPRVIGGRKG